MERAPEGSWVYFRLAREARAGRWRAWSSRPWTAPIRSLSATGAARRPCGRSARRSAQAYFQSHAGEWDRIRALHVAEAHVEAVISEVLGPGPFDLFLDLGTGTGRMLELFRERYRRGLGIDLSPAMLAYARAKLESGETGARPRAAGRHLRSAACRPDASAPR